jgi:serine phosphatase RsbU (regulator of sigma subunit)
MSLVVSKRFSNALNNLEKARKDLDYINKGLEISIEARTLEVLLQKERIEAQNRDMLSSINYASRIQTTILPDRSLLNSFFDSHYIIHLPKDIVSGDFYWLREYNNKIFIALADCTGHGIPGAFMSFLGHSLLNEAFIRFTSLNDMTHLLQPNIIMNYLRTRIKESLKQTGDTGEVSDGMDLGFCIYDKNTSDIKFSGANIPLVIIRKRTDTIEAELSSNKIEVFRIDSNREMLYVKPDRMPLGIYVNEVSFTNYNIHIEKGDQLYIFTDGFEDQMGGEKDKKFSRSRLLQLIRSIAGESNNDQYNQLMDVFMDWKSAANQEQIDDVSFIGLKV